MDGPTGAEQLSDRPERMAGKLQRTPSRRVEGRDLDHRRDNQFPGDLPAIRKDTLASPLNLDTRALGEAVPSNGTLGSEFGQKFHPANDSCPPTAIAA